MELARMILIVGGQLLAAGAVYGAIRSDLRHAIQQAERANQRIDSLLNLKGQQ